MRAMEHDLFGDAMLPATQSLGEGAVLLRGRALREESSLLRSLADVIDAAPLRHMVTSRGFRMSVGMTNCGDLGWISDRRGYRYTPLDPPPIR